MNRDGLIPRLYEFNAAWRHDDDWWVYEACTNYISIPVCVRCGV